MGQCVCSKNIRVKPDAHSRVLTNRLDTVRGKILKSIHQLHTISLDCSEGIENCIIQNDRDLAVVLRLKYMFLKSKSVVLQDLIKKIDEIEPGDKSRKKKDAVLEAETVLESLEVLLALKDVAKIVAKEEKDYKDLVMKEIKKFNLNETEAEKFVDSEIKERNSSPSRRNRRKYSRRVTSL